MKTQWVIVEQNNQMVKQAKYTSLTKALNSLTIRLTGVTMFYVKVPDGKTFLVSKESKERNEDN